MAQTYGDLDPNAMPDMYHKEVPSALSTEVPLDAQGNKINPLGRSMDNTLRGLFAGSLPQAPVDPVMTNMGSRATQPNNIFPTLEDSQGTNILSQLEDNFPEGYPNDVPATATVERAVFPRDRQDVLVDQDNPNLGVSTQRRSAEDPNITGGSPWYIGTEGSNMQTIANAVKNVTDTTKRRFTDPTKAPYERLMDAAGAGADWLIDQIPALSGELLKGWKWFTNVPGQKTNQIYANIDEETDRMQREHTGDISQYPYGKTARKLIGKGSQAIRQGKQTLQDAIRDRAASSQIRHSSQVPPRMPFDRSLEIDANDPNSPNMGYGPSFDERDPIAENIKETTDPNSDVITIEPEDAPMGERSPIDNIINTLGLLEMSEAQRAGRIAALPNHIRDAVLQRVTNIMQSADIGDDIY